ncbi:MAG: YciI family protein [Candidatus Velthaea sp.]
MRYMALIYAPPMPPDMEMPPEAMQAWFTYTEDARKAGVYVDASQLASHTAATTVAMHEGKRIVTDGPFAETKEILGGYYIFECPSIDQALDWAAKCPIVHVGGKVEVRPLVDN